MFEPDCRGRQEIAVDETKIEIDGEEVYVWTAVDCDTLQMLSVDVSSGRSSLDALLFPKEVLKACRGRRYDWPLELLDCDYEEKRGEIGHSLKSGSACSNTEPDTSGADFRTIAPSTPHNHGSQPSLPSTMPQQANLDTLTAGLEEILISP